jgi:imidazolonepropionase-like amidohydrolase
MSGVGSRRVRMLLATLFIAAWPSFPPHCVGQTQPRALVLTGATIYPSPERAAVRKGVVVVREGRVAAVGPRGSVAEPDGAEVLAQILASLTTNPARRFGLTQRTGRVAPGMDADLVVLEGDPASDVRGLARVRYTLRQGRIIYRSIP